MTKDVNRIINKILIGLPALVAFILGMELNIQFFSSAAVISIVAYLNLKDQPLSIIPVIKWTTSITLGILLASFLNVIGYNHLYFLIIFVILISLLMLLKYDDCMVITFVIFTHIVTSEKITTSLVLNEYFLFILGIFSAYLGIFIYKYLKSKEESDDS